MSPDTPRLILSPRGTDDGERLAAAAAPRGWQVERLKRWRVPADYAAPPEVALYGEPLFCRVLAAQIDRVLLEPPHDWLLGLPSTLLGRAVGFTTLGALSDERPLFVKPPDDKLFPAAVYAKPSALLAERADLGPDEPVLISDPVRIAREYRVHLLAGEAVACSRYAIAGDLDIGVDDGCHRARAVAEQAAAAADTPSAVVIDVGPLADGRWIVVEANPCFGAGLYAAEPGPVLDVLRAACLRPGDGDGRFCNPVVLEE